MAAGSTKRKKFHDKDKYYRLAKEQGLRSRAAFKLTQINRKFPVLEKCQSAILDLCAAPGGWTQIASRTVPKSCAIVAVDILPIRSIPGVTTLLGDITTDKCRADIKRALQGRPVDVVLHDGAPNVGADYAKDAYEQNEISLHALRCATQHLVPGGTFITKIYRSRDYASYHWVLQQLFDNVSALKPKASRAQSAEIFLIAQQFKAPAKLDPKFLDPKHVFASVEGDSSGGGNLNATALSIFNKNFDTKKQRQRQGYDMDHFDATMRHITSVSEFVKSETMKDAIQILSSSTGLKFTCATCQDGAAAAKEGGDDAASTPCSCQFYLHHPLTTTEIKESVCDLQVLNKKDFKVLLTWRTNMQEAVKAAKERKRDVREDDMSAHEDDSDALSDSDDSEKEEEAISGEIAKIRERRMRDAKRKKKKERTLAGKRRRHAAMGMDLNAIDVPEHDKIFSLATLTSHGDLEAVSEVNLDRVTDEQVFGDSDEDVIVGGDGDSDDESRGEEIVMLKREKELDSAYEMYLQNTKNSAAQSDSKMAKRSKKNQRLKVAMEADEDQEMAFAAPSGVDYDTKAYAKLLQGPDDSADEDEVSSEEEEDDDGFDANPMTPEEYAKAKKRKTNDSNPLIHKFAEEPTSLKTARWFSNPLFQSIGQAAETAISTSRGKPRRHADDNSVASDNDTNSDGDAKMPSTGKKPKGLSAEEVLAAIPKTDKEKRHERRLKAKERDEWRKARKARNLDEEERDFELAPAANEASLEEVDRRYEHLSEAQQKKIKEANELIKAGLGGKGTDKSDSQGSSIMIVPQSHELDRPLPILDTRKYDSDHEDYDSDDYARTLAIGTMLLRRSKEKAFVDASYNRYAWNDPEDLPEWFLDDENKNYRPQLPIPPALLAKMKEKMIALSEKPIQKVAEARARKNRRAKAKLVAAKKQAEGIANSSEMSDAMKLKAISKALRGKEVKRPSKTYVVAKKGRGSSTAKPGTKQVDKRMKSDKRAMTKIQKKSKHGKQNGMTGSKKRRHHS